MMSRADDESRRCCRQDTMPLAMCAPVERSRTRNTPLPAAAPSVTYSGRPKLAATSSRLSPPSTAQQIRTSVTSATLATGHKAWMPRSCRSMCMVAASTSYEAHAGPVLVVTAMRYRPCGTTDTAVRCKPAHGQEADRQYVAGGAAVASGVSRTRATPPGQMAKWQDNASDLFGVDSGLLSAEWLMTRIGAG
jgi:hypothetical protein